MRNIEIDEIENVEDLKAFTDREILKEMLFDLSDLEAVVKEGKWRDFVYIITVGKVELVVDFSRKCSSFFNTEEGAEYIRFSAALSVLKRIRSAVRGN